MEKLLRALLPTLQGPVLDVLLARNSGAVKVRLAWNGVKVRFAWNGVKVRMEWCEGAARMEWSWAQWRSHGMEWRCISPVRTVRAWTWNRNP